MSCRGKKRGKKRAETLVGRVCGLLLQTGLSEPTAEGGLLGRASDESLEALGFGSTGTAKTEPGQQREASTRTHK